MRFSLLWPGDEKKHTGLLIVVCLLDGRFNGKTAEPLRVSMARHRKIECVTMLSMLMMEWECRVYDIGISKMPKPRASPSCRTLPQV